jgi:Tol biopolymer transport system component
MSGHAGTFAAMLLLASAPAGAGALVTERVNVNPTTGLQADGPSDSPVLSADGCIVAFVSQSGTLAPAGYGLTTGSQPQVYAVDRCVTPHTIELVSVTSDGSAAADRGCYYPNISADGRYVSFISSAGNLPMPSGQPSGQVFLPFVRDRVAHTTLSPLEAWRKTPNNGAGVYFDTLGTTPLARQHYMSDDASEFAFDFFDGVSATVDVDALHVAGGATTLYQICADGAPGRCYRPQISGDGSTIVFITMDALVASDVNGHADVYAYDTATGSFSLVSVTAANASASNPVDSGNNLGISDDGNLVAFSSDSASNFPGNQAYTLLAKNRASGDVTLISAAPGGIPESPIMFGDPSYEVGMTPQLSADGNRIAFGSNNAAITPWPAVTGHLDAVVADLTLKRLGSVCLSASGYNGNAGCDTATISADGKWVAFRSASTNLVPSDSNGQADIFVVALDPAVDVVFSSGFEP